MNDAEMTTVVLVVEHHLVRDGIRSLLSSETDLRVIGEASGLQEALALTTAPDVMVLDVGVPGLRGLHSAHELLARFPGTRLVCLSAAVDRRQVEELLHAGVKGCLVKGSGAIELAQAIRAVARGERYVPTELPDNQGGLSPREEEVLGLLAQGLTSKEIAVRLEVAVSTIETYRKQLMAKLDLHSVASLTRFALRVGIAPLE